MLKAFSKFKSLLFLLIISTLCSCGVSPASAQVYQSAKTPKYVKATGFDTVVYTPSSLNNYRRTALITNQSSTIALIVYLQTEGATSRDTTAYFLIPAGKSLKVTFTGRKIWRKAASDSVYSQVIFGDVNLSYKEKTENNFYTTYIVLDESYPDKFYYEAMLPDGIVRTGYLYNEKFTKKRTA